MFGFSPGLGGGPDGARTPAPTSPGPRPPRKPASPGSLARPRDPRCPPASPRECLTSPASQSAPAASPSYDERHSVLCFLCFLPMAVAGQSAQPWAAAKGAGAWPPLRGLARPPPQPVGIEGPRRKRTSRPEVAPPLAGTSASGSGDARGRFKARAGPVGPVAAVAEVASDVVAAPGVRRRPRSARLLGARGCDGGAMDQAVGDLKQALPCVAETPTIHVEVHQRSGR